MIYFLFFLISFLSSMAGSICGIGGGVIIKPVLDAFGILSVSQVSFLSGCTVTAMSLFSLLRRKSNGSTSVNLQVTLPLAIGAAVGGAVGKSLFSMLILVTGKENLTGAIQAVVLMILTLATLAYTMQKKDIITHQFNNKVLCVVIGLCLGMFSSFLGIGGGPINLVVLSFFFSMSTKEAAQNSLYIILISQITNLLITVITRSVPDVSFLVLRMMIAAGITGGLAGSMVNQKIDEHKVDRLFEILMAVIILISLYNIVRYANLMQA